MRRDGQKDTSAKAVMAAANTLGTKSASFTNESLSEELGLQLYEERARLRECTRYLVRRGRLIRVRKGEFKLQSSNHGLPKPQKQLIMWRFLRMQKTVTLEDLKEVADASLEYAKEWINHLVVRGIVKDHANGNFQLVKDSVEMPINQKKADRLRELRLRSRKQAIDSIKKAQSALDSAMTAINQLSE